MEKHLDTLIEEARARAGIFGLIYIDLDGFKQMNDQYGHHVGDMYLQEAASRMKRQLRPGDTWRASAATSSPSWFRSCASRSEVQEIADRLERCFEEPFTVQRHVLHGSASIGIALYPEDADNRERPCCAWPTPPCTRLKHARKAQTRAMQASRSVRRAGTVSIQITRGPACAGPRLSY